MRYPAIITVYCTDVNKLLSLDPRTCIRRFYDDCDVPIFNCVEVAELPRKALVELQSVIFATNSQEHELEKTTEKKGIGESHF